MHTITERIPDFITYEEALGYCSERALFFDIETTGLSPAASIVFLIGIVKKSGGVWRLTQWLAQRPEDEPELLQAFFDAAATCDTLIHFNGTTFDLPFLRERIKRVCDMPSGAPSAASTDGSGPADSDGSAALPSEYALDHKASIDLYQKFRPLKSSLRLPRMNQSTLEQFLGWPRRDRLSGKQMVALFRKYTASQEPLLRDLLLLHNHDDLLGMTGLLRLCAYSLLFEGQFASVRASLRQNDPHLTKRSDVRNRSFSDDPDDPNHSYPTLELRLTLDTALPQDLALSVPCPLSSIGADQCAPAGASAPLPDRSSCEDSAPCYALTASGAQAVLSIPGFHGELRHFFPNYRDYYYLALEDQAVHKSVAAFVDPQYRTRATPENCYIKKSGLFFPQPREYFTPAFKASCESKELFFACPEPEPALFPEPGSEPEFTLSFPEEALTAYAATLLRMFMRHA